MLEAVPDDGPIKKSSGLTVQFTHQTVKDYVVSSEQHHEEKCSHSFPNNYYCLLIVAANCNDPRAESIAASVFEYAQALVYLGF